MIMDDVDKGSMYAGDLNCQLGVWPMKYLGVSICGTMLHVAQLAVIE